MSTQAKPESVFTQAATVIKKFGDEQKLCAALNAAGHPISITRIYRWTYPKSRGGTGGLIPTQQLQHVLKAARLQGVLIMAEDLYTPGSSKS